MSRDDGIMFELFNEPSKTRHIRRLRTPTWDEWLAAHQPILKQIRDGGSLNAIILDGLQWGQTLSGAPTVPDPECCSNAVHPYAGRKLRSPVEWDAAFGTFGENAPRADHRMELRLASIPNAAATFRRSRRTCLPMPEPTASGSSDGLSIFLCTLLNLDGAPTNYDGFVCEKGVPYAKGATFARWLNSPRALPCEVVLKEPSR